MSIIQYTFIAKCPSYVLLLAPSVPDMILLIEGDTRFTISFHLCYTVIVHYQCHLLKLLITEIGG